MRAATCGPSYGRCRSGVSFELRRFRNGRVYTLRLIASERSTNKSEDRLACGLEYGIGFTQCETARMKQYAYTIPQRNKVEQFYGLTSRMFAPPLSAAETLFKKIESVLKIRFAQSVFIQTAEKLKRPNASNPLQSNMPKEVLPPLRFLCAAFFRNRFFPLRKEFVRVTFASACSNSCSIALVAVLRYSKQQRYKSQNHKLQCSIILSLAVFPKSALLFKPGKASFHYPAFGNYFAYM